MPPRPWPVDEFCQLSRAPMFLSRRLFFTASSGIAGLIPDRPQARWHSCGRSGSPTPSFAAWAGRAASRGRSRDPFGVPSRAAGEPAAPGSGALLPLPESPAAVGVGISDLPMPFVGEGYALQAPDAPLQVQSDNGTLVHGRRPSYADDLAGGVSLQAASRRRRSGCWLVPDARLHRVLTWWLCLRGLNAGRCGAVCSAGKAGGLP
jgi:hypothetical protein